MTCCINDAPRPPYSVGHPTHVHPPLVSSRSHSRRTSNASCSRPGPPASPSSAYSPIRCSASQSRTSARNASSAAVKRRSTSGALRGGLLLHVLEHRHLLRADQREALGDFSRRPAAVLDDAAD